MLNEHAYYLLSRMMQGVKSERAGLGPLLVIGRKHSPGHQVHSKIDASCYTVLQSSRFLRLDIQHHGLDLSSARA